MSPAARSGCGRCEPPHDRHRNRGPGPAADAGRELADLTDEVAAVCQRYGVPAWTEDDRERLEAALWRSIHPDLADSPADPYHDPDED